jgi:DNA repair exonuclease SbcCD ATPase subunit
VNDALQTLQGSLSEAELRLSEITKVQREVNTRQHLLRDVQSSIKSSQKEISLWTKEIESASKGSVAFNEDTITQLKEEYGLFLGMKQEYLDEREMYDLATVILRDSGIKSRIIKQYVPVINTLVNKYLAAMDFFVKFELNEQFEEKILSRHRDDFTYDSFSEGEKMRIDLSLLFTWRSIARMKNSAHTNLLILDEVFDASLDANGCDEFLKLIHSLEDSNIFVISHKGDVLHDKFSNTLRFTKQKNFSRIM